MLEWKCSSERKGGNGKYGRKGLTEGLSSNTRAYFDAYLESYTVRILFPPRAMYHVHWNKSANVVVEMAPGYVR